MALRNRYPARFAPCVSNFTLAEMHLVHEQGEHAPADGRPVMAKVSNMGAQKGLLGGKAPNIAFLLTNSNIDPTCEG